MGGERDVDRNMQRMTALGQENPVKIDVTSGDYDVDFPIKAISSTGGSIIMADFTCEGVTVEDVAIPAGGAMRYTNISKIKSVGTDAENIVLWPDD